MQEEFQTHDAESNTAAVRPVDEIDKWVPGEQELDQRLHAFLLQHRSQRKEQGKGLTLVDSWRSGQR